METTQVYNDRWEDNEGVVYMHKQILYATTRNGGIKQFAATWMELENFILSEVSQKDKYQMFSLVCGI